MYLEKIFVKRYFLQNNSKKSQSKDWFECWNGERKKKEFATFVNGIRDNYEIDKKLFGIDAAIALVDDPDKKQSINLKDVAIPESENFRLCIQGSGSITFRLSDYLSGPDRIRDKKRLNLKASWALSECEEHISEKIDVYVKTVKSLKNIIKSNMRKTKREKARTLLDRYMKTFCRATKSVLRHGRTSRFCCLMFKTSCRLSIRPDRQEARTWRKERNRKMCTPSVHIETNNAGPPMAEPFLLD
ncbi:unnamed protein product [Rhizophagus irregularis]|nr:unnamed protein product [Rhizophagus irregularis]